jgi:decaprenyl-phosphate phosphoribosyltransferase
MTQPPGPAVQPAGADVADAAGDDRPPAPDPRGGLVGGLIREARPKQWLKNVLVFSAPASAGVLFEATPLLQTVVAFLAFCLVASGTYFINDARDVEADRVHVKKRFRPIAAGIVPVSLGYVGGVVLLAAGLALSFAISWQLALVIGGYLVLTTSYSLWLKHEPVIDLVAVAAGFVLRAVAGAAATGIPTSSWFLVVVSLGSLFIVAGKREAELRSAEHDKKTRSTLQAYSVPFLNYVQSASTGALLVAYSLWAFEGHTGLTRTLSGLSILPFAVGVLRYAMLVDGGGGEAPEDAIAADRILLVCGLVLVVLVGVSVYVV